MTRQVVTTGRAWPMPTGGSTLHCIGDIHTGVITANKLAKSMDDMLNGKLLPQVVAHLQTGDQIDTITSPNIATFQAWWAQLPGSKYLAVGNHELDFSAGTTAAWAAWTGMPDKNYTAQLATGLKLIVVGPDALVTDETNGAWNGPRIRLSPATLTWLDTQLGATSDACLIACHAPIKDTVVEGAANSFSSHDDPWYVNTNDSKATSDTVLAVLAAHANAKAWISGHTHSLIEAPDLVKAVTVGSHTMAMINNSALVYTGLGNATDIANDPLNTLYVTYFGDRIEVRFRDNGAGIWGQGSGPTVARLKAVTL